MDVEGLVKKAREAAKKRNYGYAIELFQNAVFMDPNHSKARQELREVEIKRIQEEGGSSRAGRFLKGLGPMAKIKTLGARKKFEEQARACEEYLRGNPRDARVIFKLAMALVEMGARDSAMEEFEDVIKIDGKHADAISQVGLLHERKGDFPRAITHFERVLKIRPEDQLARKKIRDLAAKQTIKVDQHEDTEDYRKKLKDEERAVQMEAESHVLRTEDEVDEAIQAALEKAQEEPEKPELFRRVAELYRKKGDYEGAEKYYNQALEINPEDYFSKEAIDDLHINRMEKEIAALKAERTKTGGADPEVKQKLKEVRKKLVAFQIDAYTRRAKDRPTDTRLRFDLGRFLFAGGRVNDAIASFQKTIDDPKLRTESHHFLGKCFQKKKTYDLAIKQFEVARGEVRSFNDKAKEITYDLAKTQLLKKDKLAAQAELEKIYSVDINFRDVAELMDKLMQETGGGSISDGGEEEKEEEA